MDINLFSGGPFVLLSAANAVVTYYLMQKLLRHKSLKQTLPFLVGVTVIVAGVALWGIRLAFPADKMPPDLLFMVLPASLSVALVGLGVWVRRFMMIGVATGNILLGVAVSLLLVNSYYHYYPSIASVFGVVQTKNAQNTTVVYTQKTHIQQPVTTEALLQSNSHIKGRLDTVNILGTASKFHARTSYVYVPPINSAGPKVQLPVIVLLPGIPGGPADWANAGNIVNIMDQFAAAHHQVAPYVVLADNTGSATNDTECVNSPRGNVDTYLSVDVPNFMAKNYGTSHDPSQWAIGGLSMGGMCGLLLTLRHDDVYHYFLDFGGETGPEVGSQQKTTTALFDGSKTAWQQSQPEWLLDHRTYPHVGGFFAVGKSDKVTLVAGMTKLHKQAQAAGMDTVLQLVGGQHTFNVWQQSYTDALPWISNRLGATSCTANCY